MRVCVRVRMRVCAHLLSRAAALLALALQLLDSGDSLWRIGLAALWGCCADSGGRSIDTCRLEPRESSCCGCCSEAECVGEEAFVESVFVDGAFEESMDARCEVEGRGGSTL